MLIKTIGMGQRTQKRLSFVVHFPDNETQRASIEKLFTKSKMEASFCLWVQSKLKTECTPQIVVLVRLTECR